MNGTFQVVSPREFPVRLEISPFTLPAGSFPVPDSTPSRAVYREQAM